jgi:hypothetical protein
LCRDCRDRLQERGHPLAAETPPLGSRERGECAGRSQVDDPAGGPFTTVVVPVAS